MARRIWMAAALAALAAWGSCAHAQNVRASPVNPVATVNGVAISRGDLDAVLKFGEPDAVPQTTALKRQRQVEALALLIDVILMRQYLGRETRPVTAEEMAQRLDELKIGLKRQDKTIADFCHDTNQTEEQFRSGVEDHLRWSAYVVAKVTDDVVKKYHADNRDFFDGTKVEASHIVLRVPAAAAASEKTEAKTKLTALRKLLVEGKADFAEMAWKHSQDPRGEQGGAVGAFTRRCELDEPFCKAAFALKEGEISNVVETDYGFHLIKLTKRHEGKATDFATIKEAVREFCAEDLRQSILAAERKRSEIKIDLP